MRRMTQVKGALRGAKGKRRRLGALSLAAALGS